MNSLVLALFLSAAKPAPAPVYTTPEKIMAVCSPEWRVTSSGDDWIMSCPATRITIVVPKDQTRGTSRAMARRAR